MDFRTLVELPRHEIEIKHTDKIMLFGSCFAENIGLMLIQNKFCCDVNPFGILYNPVSVLKALNEVRSSKEYCAEDLFFHQGNWHSTMHHSSFSDTSKDKCLLNINSRLQLASEGFLQTNCMMVTFGTAYVYVLKESGRVVGNCHKLPEKIFNRRMLSIEEIVTDYSEFIRQTVEVNPHIKWLFTVSPIRHLKDGMHGNQLSKAILLLSIERLKQLFPSQVFYFPSYELMTDELRDYRFYADDMVHSSAKAIGYIWECFVKSYFSEHTQKYMHEWEQILKALNHKPFDISSESYKSFLMQNVLNIERIKEKYPYLDVEKELELCHIRLRQ